MIDTDSGDGIKVMLSDQVVSGKNIKQNIIRIEFIFRQITPRKCPWFPEFKGFMCYDDLSYKQRNRQTDIITFTKTSLEIQLNMENS